MKNPSRANSFELAHHHSAVALLNLLCSAKREIGLTEEFCSDERSTERLKWMRECCDSSRVWMAAAPDYIIGLAILSADNTGIDYVVVAETARGKGPGPDLIGYIQSLDEIHTLRAEARNERSRRMLEKCGFQEAEWQLLDYPVLVWNKIP